MISEVVKYKSSDGGEITEDEIIEMLNLYNDGQNYEYKSYNYTIQTGGGNLCGYVSIDDELPYEGHGGITGGGFNCQGFDCAHWDDITIHDINNIKHREMSKLIKEDSIDNEFKNILNIFNKITLKDLSKSSFKTANFIHDECKKMIDEYIKCKNS